MGSNFFGYCGVALLRCTIYSFQLPQYEMYEMSPAKLRTGRDVRVDGTGLGLPIASKLVR